MRQLNADDKAITECRYTNDCFGFTRQIGVTGNQTDVFLMDEDRVEAYFSFDAEFNEVFRTDPSNFFENITADMFRKD